MTITNRAFVRVVVVWLARALIGIGLLGHVAPPPPRAIFEDPPRTVETQMPVLCLHTRLIDEVDTWKVQRSLQLVRELGAPTIVEFFPWAYVEASPGRYDWRSTDRIIDHATNQGVRVIARVGLVPAWAREADPSGVEFTTLNTLPESAYPAFAAFVAAFAARYAGVVDHVIVWNEPNLAFEWGYAHVDPAAYVRLLAQVYPAVRAANPDAVVLAGALAPTLEPVRSAAGLDDRLYLEAMYAAGAGAYFDGLAVHTYGFALPADDPPHPERLNFRRVELLRAIMVAHGDAHKSIYITESGWNDHPRWTQAVSPAQRIAHTLDALALTESWDWLETLCFWVLRFPAATFSYPDHFTFINTTFQPKPIYYAVQAAAQGRPRPEDRWLPAPG